MKTDRVCPETSETSQLLSLGDDEVEFSVAKHEIKVPIRSVYTVYIQYRLGCWREIAASNVDVYKVGHADLRYFELMASIIVMRYRF